MSTSTDHPSNNPPTPKSDHRTSLTALPAEILTDILTHHFTQTTIFITDRTFTLYLEDISSTPNLKLQPKPHPSLSILYANKSLYHQGLPLLFRHATFEFEGPPPKDLKYEALNSRRRRSGVLARTCLMERIVVAGISGWEWPAEDFRADKVEAVFPRLRALRFVLRASFFDNKALRDLIYDHWTIKDISVRFTDYEFTLQIHPPDPNDLTKLDRDIDGASAKPRFTYECQSLMQHYAAMICCKRLGVDERNLHFRTRRASVDTIGKSMRNIL